jgi:hypothetical protein
MNSKVKEFKNTADIGRKPQKVRVAPPSVDFLFGVGFNIKGAINYGKRPRISVLRFRL